MKAVTIYQPHASLAAIGAKKFETRSWATNYRGPIAIHAGKVFAPHDQHNFSDVRFLLAAMDVLFPSASDGLSYGALYGLPRGAVIATADLIGCHKIISHRLYGSKGRIEMGHMGRFLFSPENELLFGDWTPGRYAWELANVQMLPQPIPCRGQQGLWNWKPPSDFQ